MTSYTELESSSSPTIHRLALEVGRLRSEIFFVGITFVIAGPVLTMFALSSCLGTILTGHIFACVTDIAYVVIGGVFFVVGITTAFIGVFAPDPTRAPPPTSLTPATLAAMPGTPVTCKKCGKGYDSGLFFCPSCGQRPV